jgi:hypothetical protein
MRPKIVVVVIGIAVVATVAVLMTQKPARETPPEQTADGRPNERQAVGKPVPVKVKGGPTNAPDTTEIVAPIKTPTEDDNMSEDEKHQAMIDARVQELSDLGFDDEPDSLNNILSELTNPEQEIRKAAVDAAVQFGSREAIPALTAALQQIGDFEEKTSIKEAIEFLKLPKVSEPDEKEKKKAN